MRIDSSKFRFQGEFLLQIHCWLGLYFFASRRAYRQVAGLIPESGDLIGVFPIWGFRLHTSTASLVNTLTVDAKQKPDESYAVHEGAYGRTVVLELRNDLVAHAHAETQIAFWLGGSRSDARVVGQVVEYSEHTALGVNPYESHDAKLLDDAGPAIFLIFYINKDWLDKLRSESGRRFFFPNPQVPISQAVRQACWKVLDIVVSPFHESRESLNHEIEKLIVEAIDASMVPAKPVGLGTSAPLIDHRLRAAITYMREHVSDPVAVDDVAGKVGLSRAHFFALFRDQLNTTPQVFWSAVKVEEAIRRLAQRADPLTSVALDLGFSTPGNFSRFFREHMGVTPSHFRKVSAGPQRYPVTGVQ
jgi:AraC-like DNA-binding protein